MTSNCYIDNMSLYTQISLYCTAYTAIYATARTLAYVKDTKQSRSYIGPFGEIGRQFRDI